MLCGTLIQARMSSSRLPGKMLMDVGGMPLLLRVLQLCNSSRMAKITALVTSIEPEDDALEQVALQNNFPCFRGSLNDVRLRYIQAARYFDLDIICRVCGDSPFVDVFSMDIMIEKALLGNVDYLRLTDTLPGHVSEVFTLKALEDSVFVLDTVEAKEHVTLALKEYPNLYKHILLHGKPAPPNAWQRTVDTATDLEQARLLCMQELKAIK